MGGYKHHRDSWQLRIRQDLLGCRDCNFVEFAMGCDIVHGKKLEIASAAVATSDEPAGLILQELEPRAVRKGIRK